MERNEGSGDRERTRTAGDVSQAGMGAGAGNDVTARLTGDVDAVIAALQGGVDAVPIETAAGLVARTRLDLQTIGVAGAQEVSVSLGALHDVLVSGRLEEAGPLLARLSAQVGDVAGRMPEDVGERLRTLAALLTDAGERTR